MEVYIKYYDYMAGKEVKELYVGLSEAVPATKDEIVQAGKRYSVSYRCFDADNDAIILHCTQL